MSKFHPNSAQGDVTNPGSTAQCKRQYYNKARHSGSAEDWLAYKELKKHA